MLTDHERREIDHALALYPDRRAGCIDALKSVQRHRGWISDEAVKDVATYLGLSESEVDGVATFYNLLFRRPVGRHVLLLCDSVSCWIMGQERLCAALTERLGIGVGETTPDRRMTLLPVPCLGHCDHAPALMVDGDLHGDVEPDVLGALLGRYR